jgi:hypothetical protein
MWHALQHGTPSSKIAAKNDNRQDVGRQNVGRINTEKGEESGNEACCGNYSLSHIVPSRYLVVNVKNLFFVVTDEGTSVTSTIKIF